VAVLTIRVVPRASKPGPAGMRDGAVLIRLNAAPVEGAANAELVELLARLLDLPKRNITIVSGEKSRLKRVRVEGMDDASALSRLAPNS
jgi:uncharacterized protein